MRTAPEPRLSTRDPVARRYPAWTGHAFGIALRGGFCVDGVEPGHAYGMDGPATVLELAEEDELASGWNAADGAERVREWRYEDGSPEGALDLHGDRGYRLAV